jgi:hypothetical protein
MLASALYPPMDVWLKFDDPEDLDDEASYEANTFKISEDHFVVEWSHTAVGQITQKDFDTYEEATAWLEANGFQDFSS